MDDSHFNKNLPCTFAIKVTSDDPDLAELVEISIVPLAKDFSPSEIRLPLTIYIRPDSNPTEIIKDPFRAARYDYPTYMLARDKDLAVAQMHGVSVDDSWARIQSWFETLQLGDGKKIIPVAYGFGYMMPFLIKWLGYTSYNDIFDWHYRDPFAIVSFDMDRAYVRNAEYRWRKLDLTSVLTCALVEKSQCLDTMSQAVDEAKLYRKLMNIV